MKIPTFTVVPKVPFSTGDHGQLGNIAYDSEYFYIYTSAGWKSTAFSGTASDVPYTIKQSSKMKDLAFATSDYFFLYTNGIWKNFAISMLDGRKISRGGPTTMVLPIYRFRLSSFPVINIATSGVEGMVSYNDQYFYIYSLGMWRARAISSFSAFSFLQSQTFSGSPPAGIPDLTVGLPPSGIPQLSVTQT